ncbi:SIMPL domain-containing protein [Halorussus salilacus]|uniref:SIMPL domain-containing protein n=1 Tax=Halorussus salilacus TaxID=2953750 RepID=UPI00209EEFC8|nr:SIMPL domain-containing protein [Halorussus salilacus]USZ69166.1 SIMPL domain-containing protein [Halorussus salilacus]
MTQPTITTDATARRDAPPDRAVIAVTAIGEGDSAAVARESARDRAATVRESLAEDARSPDRIDTVELRVEDAAQAFDPDTDAPYRAVERLRIECHPEAASEVVVRATDAGATVRNVSFDLREDERRRLQDEALAGAMERAREKAERVAASEGLAVGGVLDVSTTDDDAGMSSIVDDALAGNGGDDLGPTPVVASETVEVVYELVDPDDG